jgi:dihydroorotase
LNVILRGVRVIDPLAGLDADGQDVWLESGLIRAVERHIDSASVPVIDFTPAPGAQSIVMCPGFIDLHAHLRQPGDATVETIASGAQAAAAGGFTHVVAMANTDPPIDTPERVAAAVGIARGAAVHVMHVAAVSRGLQGEHLVDIRGCIEAGAVALSDDGRNASGPELLSEALRQADEFARPVFVHPEDEKAIARLNYEGCPVMRCPDRPPETEVDAVKTAVKALARADCGHLHLQHVSASGSLDPLRRARAAGHAITAEVTPHHLARWAASSPPSPESLRKVNPPLRSWSDRNAVLTALREGLIDAVATDHAPHRAAEKTASYAAAAAGMVGFETALAVCLTLGDMGGAWLPVLVERLTAGPHRVLGSASGVPEPRLTIGQPATCVLFDPEAAWTVTTETLRSRSHNTPWIGAELRGRVLLTIANGRVVHSLDARIPVSEEEAAHA